MDIRRGRLVRVMKFFGKEIDMRSYDDRLILQKLVYILQCKGVAFDYFFGWYIRGPYSSALAADGYFIGEKKHKELGISPKEESVVKRTKELLGCSITDSKKMEIIASLLFLKQKNMSLDDSGVIMALKDLKPWLTVEEIADELLVLKRVCGEVFNC
jgi:uncharacterized protein YwgA